MAKYSMQQLGNTCFAIASFVFFYIIAFGEFFKEVPIDQRLCPPNVGVAPDGTCGIYDTVISLWFVAMIVFLVSGIAFFVIGAFKDTRRL